MLHGYSRFVGDLYVSGAKLRSVGRKHLIRSIRSHYHNHSQRPLRGQLYVLVQRACSLANDCANQRRSITLARQPSFAQCRTLHTSSYLYALHRRPGSKQNALSVTDSYDAERSKAEELQRKKDDERARLEAFRRKVEAERKEKERARLAAEQLVRQRRKELEAGKLSIVIVQKSWPAWRLASLALKETPPSIRDLVTSRTRSAWEARYEKAFVVPLARLWTKFENLQSQVPSTRAGVRWIVKNSCITAVEAMLDRLGPQINRSHSLHNEIVDELKVFDATLLQSALSFETELTEKKGIDGDATGTDKAISDLFYNYSSAAETTYVAYENFILLLSRQLLAEPQPKGISRSDIRWQSQRLALLGLVYEMGGHVRSAWLCKIEAHGYRMVTSLELFMADEGRRQIFKSKLAYHTLERQFSQVGDSAFEALSIVEQVRSTHRQCLELGFKPPASHRLQTTGLYMNVLLMRRAADTMLDDYLIRTARGLSRTLILKTDRWDRALINNLSCVARGASFTMSVVKECTTFSDQAMQQITNKQVHVYRLEILDRIRSEHLTIRAQLKEIWHALDRAQLWTGVRQMICGLDHHEAISTMPTPSYEGVEAGSDASAVADGSHLRFMNALALRSPAATLPGLRIPVEYITTPLGAFYACLDIARESLLGVDVIVARPHTTVAEQFLVLVCDTKVWIFLLSYKFLKAPFRIGREGNPLAEVLFNENIFKLCANVAYLRQHLFASYGFELDGTINTYEPGNFNSTSENTQVPGAQGLDYEELFGQVQRGRHDFVDGLHTMADWAYRNFSLQKALLADAAQDLTSRLDNSHTNLCTRDGVSRFASPSNQPHFELGPFRLDTHYGSKWSTRFLSHVPEGQKRSRILFLLLTSQAWAENLLKQKKELFDLKTKSDRVKLGPSYMRALQAYFLFVTMDEDAESVKAILSVKRLFEDVTTIAKKAGLPIDEMKLASLRQDASHHRQIPSLDMPMPQTKQDEALVLEQVHIQTQKYLKQCQRLKQQLRLRDEAVNRSTLNIWVLQITNRYRFSDSKRLLGMSAAQVAADLVSSYAFFCANGVPIQQIELDRLSSTLSNITQAPYVPGMWVLHSDQTVLNEDGTFGTKRSATPGSEKMGESEAVVWPTTKVFSPPPRSDAPQPVALKAPPKATGNLLVQGFEWFRSTASTLQVEDPSKSHDPPTTFDQETLLKTLEAATVVSRATQTPNSKYQDSSAYPAVRLPRRRSGKPTTNSPMPLAKVTRFNVGSSKPVGVLQKHQVRRTVSKSDIRKTERLTKLVLRPNSKPSSQPLKLRKVHSETSKHSSTSNVTVRRRVSRISNSKFMPAKRVNSVGR